MITVHEKPLHWAEAFGLSAVVHVVLAYFVLTTVVDLRSVFDVPEQVAPSLQITSLTLETSALTSPDIGAGDSTLTSPEVSVPVSDVLEAVTPQAAIAQTAASPTTVPDAPNPERVAPVRPVETAIIPKTVSPLRPQTQTLAPVPLTTAQPAAPTTRAITTDAALATTAPLPEAEQPAAPEPSESAPPQSTAEPDALAADLINRIRAAVGEACLIAIPQQTADGSVSVQIFTANETAIGPYAAEIFEGLDPRPVQQTVLVDPRQCAALDYIRQSVGYPTSPMALGLDTTRIASGEDLTGRLSGTGGRNITLMLVDDNGVVQDLGQYLSVAVNTARFAAPLRRTGNVRDTRQLLIAMGTGTRPQAATVQNGQLAETYFDTLTAEINGNATLVVVPFEVR